VLLICLAALILPSMWCTATRNAQRVVEFHAAIAILASGAIRVAFVTGAMYLHQDGNSAAAALIVLFLLLRPLNNST